MISSAEGNLASRQDTTIKEDLCPKRGAAASLRKIASTFLDISLYTFVSTTGVREAENSPTFIDLNV
jgi:hypothetical protein